MSLKRCFTIFTLLAINLLLPAVGWHFTHVYGPSHPLAVVGACVFIIYGMVGACVFFINLLYVTRALIDWGFHDQPFWVAWAGQWEDLLDTLNII